MEKLEYLIGKSIRFIEFFSTKKAAEFTFKVFQRTQPRKMLKDEVEFYSTTEHYTISTEIEPIEIYTKGPQDGEMFILLHGWNSNLARLSYLANVLVKQGYRCVLFDMPGHGKSILKSTNLKQNSLVFEAVLKHLNPQKPFNVLTHSFGSMVASFTLANTKYEINHLIYLTVLNRFEPILSELQKRLTLSDAVYRKVRSMGETLLQEPISGLEMMDKTSKVNYKKLSLFHDKHDKILPFTYSEKLAKGLPNTRLYAYERIGHSRMLNNTDLLKDLVQVVAKKQEMEVNFVTS